MKRVALLALLVLVSAASIHAQCNTPPFPNPRVKYLGMTTSGGYNHYWFEVTNRLQYSNLLFVPSPTLPPCGLNTSASRTWLDIFNGGGVRLYGYCALSSNSQLAKLQFFVPVGAVQPKAFFITMTDRKCKRTVKSAPVAIP